MIAEGFSAMPTRPGDFHTRENPRPAYIVENSVDRKVWHRPFRVSVTKLTALWDGHIWTLHVINSGLTVEHRLGSIAQRHVDLAYICKLWALPFPPPVVV